jgi:hypothetical protein
VSTLPPPHSSAEFALTDNSAVAAHMILSPALLAQGIIYLFHWIV